MKPGEQFHCRYCDGVRTATETLLCSHCAAPAANASVHRPKDHGNQKCPRCHNRRATYLEHSKSFLCNRCGQEFDMSDLFLLDDRPEVNAMKREKRDNQRKARR